MAGIHSCIGLLLCGGNSTRMGIEKSLVAYHGKPQCYHVYDWARDICTESYISCSQKQLNTFDRLYPVIPDLEKFGSIGPLAGLLTAFHHFPEKDFLVIGCDYPFLKKEDILDFINRNHGGQIAAAFYNRKEDVYEPMLAWYSRIAASLLTESFIQKQYSLQYFLRKVNANKYEPADPTVMVSVDTPEGMKKAKAEIRKSKSLNTYIWS